ncbi:MAG: NAD(P)H:quinone oxidoreductase [Pseudomonadota bacterium]
MQEILVLYYSQYGAVKKMADFVARGIESVDGVQARIRTVPPVSPTTEKSQDDIPESGAPYVKMEDFKECIGLALGSPTRFGNMAAPMKYLFDQLGGVWASGDTINKVAGVFSSTASLHGGQETTLISMMLPLFHLGYILLGVPYSEKPLFTTQGGGTPYGPTHVAGEGSANLPILDDEKQLCIALGKRLAETVKKMA